VPTSVIATRCSGSAAMPWLLPGSAVRSARRSRCPGKAVRRWWPWGVGERAALDGHAPRALTLVAPNAVADLEQGARVVAVFLVPVFWLF
jgi:hypothetical protein